MNSRKFTTNFESTQRSSLSFTSKNSSLSNFRVFLSKNFLFNREHRFEFPDCSTEKNVENRSPSHRSIEEKRSGRRGSFGELNFETGHRPSRRRMRMRKLFGQSTMVFASLLLVAHVSHLVMFNLSRDPTTDWRMIRRFVAIVGHDKRAIFFDQRMVTLRGGGGGGESESWNWSEVARNFRVAIGWRDSAERDEGGFFVRNYVILCSRLLRVSLKKIAIDEKKKIRSKHIPREILKMIQYTSSLKQLSYICVQRFIQLFS